jgi:penicillin-binding protein 1A
VFSDKASPDASGPSPASATWRRSGCLPAIVPQRLHVHPPAPFCALLAFPALALLYVLVLIPFTPGIGDLRKAKVPTPSVVMSSDGVVLAEFKRVNREWVPLDKIAPSVIDALIATEDQRFFEHFGLDPKRMIGARVNTLQGDVQGGSTTSGV